MRKKQLDNTPPEMAKLRDEIRQSAEARYQHRVHAVLLVAHGLNCSQVAALFGDSPRAVAYWRQRYQAHGTSGLRDEKRTGRPPKQDHGRKDLAQGQAILKEVPSQGEERDL